MERRQFLKHLGLLSTGLVACQKEAARAPAGEVRQPFRVGHATTTHLYQEKSTASFWRGVEDLSGLGFRGTEADNMIAHLSDTYGDRVAEFSERMKQHQMTLPALYHVVPEDFTARDQEILLGEFMKVGKFIRDVGGNIFNLSGPEPVPAGDRNEHIRALARFGNELGHRLQQEYGVQLGYHPEGGGLLMDREHVGILMDETRPEAFGFCPDSGHLTYMKCDLLEVFRTYRSRIIHMHAKDYDPKLEVPGAAEVDRGFAVLGKGIVDFPALVNFLVESHYTGWFMIELDPPRQGPLEDSRANFKYVTETLGLTVDGESKS
jgi:sugar phosphate isomerase/epimerase